MYNGDSAAAKKCCENLRKYLEQHKNTQILLVGEAPGYKGCTKTGVPFTSDSGEVSSKVLQGALVPEDEFLSLHAVETEKIALHLVRCALFCREISPLSPEMAVPHLSYLATFPVPSLGIASVQSGGFFFDFY